MLLAGLSVTLLSVDQDCRGNSFSIPSAWRDFLVMPMDLHITTIRPSAVRGNHFHSKRREVLIVIHSSCWCLYWDTGSGTKQQAREFSGSGAVLLQITQDCSHALLNSGMEDLLVVGMTNRPFDENDPDSTTRAVL